MSKPTPPPSKSSPEVSGVHASFHKIVTFARELNTQIQTPEIVLIGKQGHGKSSLLEAIVGHPLTVIGKEKGACTKRPIFFNIVNTPEAEKPRIVLKRDTHLKDFAEDKVIPFESLEQEIEKRNVISSTPIFVQYEFRNCWNFTIIDSPGLVPSTEKGEKGSSEISPDEIEEMIIDLAKPSQRILIFVEEVKDGSQSDMVLLAKKIDPKLDRTMFVFTKFSEQLKNFTSTRDLNRYLSSTAPSEAQSYFVTLISSKDRSKYSGKDQFKTRLEELVKEDLTLLEQLQYDRRFANSMGVVSLKKHLLEATWNKYQANIPELLKRLRVLKKKSEESLTNIQQQIKGTDSSKLRANAARYVMQFLQSIEKLLTGTLEGNPGLNGQSTVEEKSQDETGDWRNVEHTPIRFDPSEWKIPHANSKLYGGQQFERLLAEFKAVVDHISMEKLSADDIATAAGPQKLNSASSCTWASSDIAQRQIQKALLPLIDQLFNRSTFIMKRLVHIVDNMLETQRKSKRRGTEGSDSFDDLEQYPFFTHAVKDLYYKFVDETADDCKKKCKDEFFSTRLIYWELTNLDGKSLTFSKAENRDDVKKAVVSLATELFNKLRERISKAILLKSYNYFLVPMQTELWGEIQGNITCLSDEQLQELFEVNVTKNRLTDAEKDMQGILAQFGKQESTFMEYANGFAKLSPKELDF